MKHIKTTLAGLLLGLTLLWLLAESAALPVTAGLFPWRTLLVQYSGVLGMGVMSVAMLLAVRPAWPFCRASAAWPRTWARRLSTSRCC